MLFYIFVVIAFMSWLYLFFSLVKISLQLTIKLPQQPDKVVEYALPVQIDMPRTCIMIMNHVHRTHSLLPLTSYT